MMTSNIGIKVGSDVGNGAAGLSVVPFDPEQEMTTKTINSMKGILSLENLMFGGSND
jgi:hypothetical protein